MIDLEIYKKKHQIIRLISSKEALECRDFCREIVIKSESNYFPLDKDSQNFLKIINNDKRSVVLGNYLQYNFFPWNKESDSLFNLFAEFIDDFLIKNLKNNYDDFIKAILLNPGERMNENFFVRIAYQRFPDISGFLDIHRDPASTYQIGAPIISLTNSNEVERGGLFYIKDDNYFKVQKDLNLGESIIFNSSWLHGVSNAHSFNGYGIEHLLLVIHAFPNSPYNELSTQ